MVYAFILNIMNIHRLDPCLFFCLVLEVFFLKRLLPNYNFPFGFDINYRLTSFKLMFFLSLSSRLFKNLALSGVKNVLFDRIFYYLFYKILLNSAFSCFNILSSLLPLCFCKRFI